MGHYDDYYDIEEEKRQKHIEEQNKKAAKLLLEAMMMARPANKEQFNIKIKEAIYWLENS